MLIVKHVVENQSQTTSALYMSKIVVIIRNGSGFNVIICKETKPANRRKVEQIRLVRVMKILFVRGVKTGGWIFGMLSFS